MIVLRTLSKWGALAGLRIVDLSMGWAGPLAARHMADLGAEVIKIEACQHPDWWRGQDPRPSFFKEKLFEKRPNFLVLNRNKQGITLDLTDAARDLLTAKGYDPTLGARPLRRAIQRLVEDPLSEKLLWKEIHGGEAILVDAEGEEIVFRSIEGVEPPPVELAGSGSEG